MNPRSNHWLFRCSNEEPPTASPPGYTLEYGPFSHPVGQVVVNWLAKFNHQDGQIIFYADSHVYDLLHHVPGRSANRRQLLALAYNHHAQVEHPHRNSLFLSPSGDRMAADPLSDRFGVGSTAPALWILGEQANPAAASFPLPFGTQAGRALLWPEIPPAWVRVSNVLQPDETRDQARRRLPRDWDALGRPPVLCVGRVAAALLKNLRDVQIAGAVDHVQYTWRFHHDALDEWREQLHDLIWNVLRGVAA